VENYAASLKGSSEVPPNTLDPLLRPSWDAAGTDAARRRVVVDQVASLTDTSAIAWHHRLCAPGRP